MSKICVIGSSNMDYTVYVDKSPDKGMTISGDRRNIVPGGKGANQAIACYRAGGDVNFISSIGDDADGHVIDSLFSNEGIKHSFQISNKETGNATIIVEKNGENRIIIVAGANGTLDFDYIKSKIDDDVEYIVLQNEIDPKVNELIFNNFKDKKIVYNPAPAKEIDANLLKYITYFVVNESELAFYGKGSTVDEQIDYLLHLGVKNLIVTLGKQGSMMVNSIERFNVQAYKVNAVDTVAAGDTYLGYFVSGLSNGLSEKDAMDFASKASAISVTKQGAIASIPTREIVNNYLFIK